MGKYDSKGKPTNRHPAVRSGMKQARSQQRAMASGGKDSCLIAMFTIPLICCWRLVRHGSIQPR